jgi:hypothetical protein
MTTCPLCAATCIAAPARNGRRYLWTAQTTIPGVVTAWRVHSCY